MFPISQDPMAGHAPGLAHGTPGKCWVYTLVSGTQGVWLTLPGGLHCLDLHHPLQWPRSHRGLAPGH